MKRSKNYKKINLIYIMEIILILFLIIVSPMVTAIKAKDNVGWFLSDLLISVLLIYLIYKIAMRYLHIIVGEKCDFLSYSEFLETLINMKLMKRLKHRPKIHLTLLKLYNGLGYYEKSGQEIYTLKILQQKMSGLQRIEFQILYIDYLMAAEKISEQEIERLYEQLDKSKDVNQSQLIKSRKAFELRKFLASDSWQDAMTLLKSIKTKTVYEQIVSAYFLGKCCLNLGKVEDAVRAFKFTAAWGGNTKYVSLSKELLEKIPDSEEIKMIEKPKKTANRLLIYWIVFVLLSGFLLFMNYGKRYGNSIEDAYRLEYHLNSKTEAVVLYKQEVDEYQMAIIYGNDRITYCLVQCKGSAENKKYKIQRSYQINKSTLPVDERVNTLELPPEEQQFVKESKAQQYVSRVIDKFYKMDEIFDMNSFPCTGVYCDPIIEDVKIGKRKVDIMTAQKVKKELFYIWQAEDVDYQNITYFDIEIE